MSIADDLAEPFEVVGSFMSRIRDLKLDAEDVEVLLVALEQIREAWKSEDSVRKDNALELVSLAPMMRGCIEKLAVKDGADADLFRAWLDDVESVALACFE